MFRVSGYHQPTMACLGQAVQSRFLCQTGTGLVASGNCIQSNKVLSHNVNQKSLKVSIKKMLFINTESSDVSLKILLTLHHSIEFRTCNVKRRFFPGRPSLVGAVASVRVAR